MKATEQYFHVVLFTPGVYYAMRSGSLSFTYLHECQCYHSNECFHVVLFVSEYVSNKISVYWTI